MAYDLIGVNHEIKLLSEIHYADENPTLIHTDANYLMKFTAEVSRNHTSRVLAWQNIARFVQGKLH